MATKIEVDRQDFQFYGKWLFKNMEVWVSDSEYYEGRTHYIYSNLGKLDDSIMHDYRNSDLRIVYADSMETYLKNNGIKYLKSDSKESE